MASNWFSFLVSLEDILRNETKNSITGMDAFREIINLLVLRFVENKFEFNNKELGIDCKFSNLYENYCTKKHFDDDKKIKENHNKYSYKLYNLIYNKDRHYITSESDDGVITKKKNNEKSCVFERIITYTALHHGKDSQYFNFFEKAYDKNKTVFTNVKDTYAIAIQKMIAKIYEEMKDFDHSSINFDAFGDGYEKYSGLLEGNSTKSRTGQYFTNRQVINTIIEEIKPKHTELCYDPASGTGGFLISIEKYMRHQYENKKITRKQFDDFLKNNIYGNDTMDAVYMILVFNCILHGINLDNIKMHDSLNIMHDNKDYANDKFDVIVENPPFGLSYDCSHINEDKYYKFVVKNSVALFLQHTYNALKENGRAGIVIDRGILNNGTKLTNWETKIRKFLLENTNLYKIIQLPTGIFKHTHFATSIIFFNKGDKTKEIEWIEGYFDNSDKGKGDKTLLLKEGKKISIDKIKEKGWSLKWDDYFAEKKEENIQKGWIKFGEIFKNDNAGEVINKSFWNNGNNLTYSCSLEPFYSNYNDFPKTKLTVKGDILVARNGTPYIHIPKENSLYTNVVQRIQINEHFNTQYIYYYIKINTYQIVPAVDNSIPSFNLDTWKNMKIPSLSLSHQKEIVSYLDKAYEKYKIQDTIKYYGDIPIFNILLNKQYDDFDAILEFQEQLNVLNKEIDNNDKTKRLYIKGLFNMTNGEKKILDDVVNIKKGTFNTQDIDNKGEYPYYNASYNNPAGKHSQFSVDLPEYIIFIKDGGNKSNPLSLSSGMAKSFYVTGKSAVQHGNVILTSKKNLKLKYLYNYLESHRIDYMKVVKYNSGLGHLSMEYIKKIVIIIPSLEGQNKIIKQIEDLESVNSHFNKYNKIIQDRIKIILDTVKNLSIETTIKEPTYTEYQLSSFAKPIVQGKNLTETSPTKTKEYKYPYYTTQNSPDNSPLYCKTASYSGQHILVTRIEQNQGTIKLISGDFTANSDFYVIKLEDDYESYYDIIKDQLENYDFKKLVEEHPIIVKIKDKEQPSKHIGLSHLNNFMVKLEDQVEEPTDEKQVDSDEEQSNEKHQNEQLDESSEESIKEPEEKPKKIIQQNNTKTQPVKPLNQKVIQNAKKKNITIA